MAFEKLFQSFQPKRGEEKLDGLSRQNLAQNVPPCLQKIVVQSKMFPCLICGKLFRSTTAIVQHSNLHNSDYKVSSLVVT